MFEEQLIRQVRGGLLGIKQGTKTPEEVYGKLVILKKYNVNMYEELVTQFNKLTNNDTENIKSN